MEPPEIERLDERTIQRIAAGEVVERPASVVKELIENSLDAGATRVAVSVEAGGTEGIRVRDDGVGIPADQLEAAVAEHATSKIGDIEDLEAGVGTLGFRGEALYTVGAVSRLTVRSRPPDADVGAEVTVEGGDVGEVRPAGCPTGTTVEVDDLFYNTPARKKFLKRVSTEFDHVNTVVTGYALANPDVAVSLEHDGRETFATEGNGDLRSAVLAVYGREVAESMLEVDWEPESEEEGAPPATRVTGLVSHPETTRSARDYLATYVNDRYVTAGALREAVLEAYGGQLAPDRYPFAVLFVEVPPDEVDVNVHPRKLEVRFDREAGVRAAVESAVESALLDHGLIRSTAPRGRSAPDEVDVAPESTDGEVVGGAGAAGGRRGDEGDGTDTGTTAEIDPKNGSATELEPDDEDAWAVEGLAGDSGSDAGADRDSSRGDDASHGGEPDRDGDTDLTRDVDRHDDADRDAGVTSSESDRPSPRSWQSGGAEAGGTEAGGTEAGDDDRNSEDDRGSLGSHGSLADASGVAADSGSNSGFESDAGPESDADRVPDADPTPRRSTTSQRTLAGEETSDERAYDSLPSLRVLGQLHDTYVVAEAPDGLVLIDQHAADERVNYERLRREFADGPPAQALAEPVTVELTAREAALFGEFLEELSGVGFRAERAGEREVVVEAVPAVFDAALDPELLRDVLTEFVTDAARTAESAEEDGSAADAPGSNPVTDAVDELLADLACYPSVTGNTSLTEGRVVDLLDRLDACENPYACPHGRPVVIRLDREELGSRFERDYPGHAGRRAE
ncbi:DNA mismatch repair protein MutL [Halorubrum aquaticum]|uniref:DNA mismatch repair protein MutL n=1 Tax=Halorubrum aquaticum TaxID=387340 RepID=A0A1I3A2Y6_9EURY|nr:DNA mismatch repair endonuclease MutL [Halorubrum aquaticum]SFH44109.1 DNA mismatch repair protein MutL [Halorubrum aquaticum]